MACWCSAARAGVLARRSARQAPADRRTTTTTRSIAYRYDGLSRLTGADESGSSTNRYAYGYDLAGNRSSVTLNGTTTTASYNAANQVTNSGYRYAAAGNRLSDGTTSHVYDALNRVTSSGGVSATYNNELLKLRASGTHLAPPTGSSPRNTACSWIRHGLVSRARLCSGWGCHPC
ncbi:MAG: hypothetical protein MI924_13820 [Chloroflexales bacterium]|nr:hypothetical protein [Chloroflexales bacterium]